MTDFDGLIVASPVHYACATGSVLSFLSRAFFSAARSDVEIFRLKPAASIAIARRAGADSTLEQINKFFTISEMPVISGRYWNNVFGRTVGEVNEDKEGIQNLKILAKNFAYFLKCKEAAKQMGINPPEKEKNIEFYHFIR